MKTNKLRNKITNVNNDYVGFNKIKKKLKKVKFAKEENSENNKNWLNIIFGIGSIIIVILIIFLIISILKVPSGKKEPINKNLKEKKIINNPFSIIKEEKITTTEKSQNENLKKENVFDLDIFDKSLIEDMKEPNKINIKLDEKYQNFIELCMKKEQENNNNVIIKYNNDPLVSIIKIVDSESDDNSYIIPSIHSIQNQKLNNFEIIIVNSLASNKKSNIAINQLIEKDQRIKLIRTNESLGILYSISIGVLNSRGKYIMILDKKDMFISGDLLDSLFLILEKNNYDMIEFETVFSANENIYSYSKEEDNKFEIEPPYLNELGLSGKYFDNKFIEKKQLSDKIVKKDLFFDALEKYGKDIYSKFLINQYDYILTFMLFKKAKTFLKIGKYGIIRFDNLIKNSTLKEIPEEKKKEDQILFDYIFYFNILFNFSENTEREKEFVAKEVIKYLKMIKSLGSKKYRSYTLETLDNLIDCEKININYKSVLRQFYYYIKNNY